METNTEIIEFREITGYDGYGVSSDGDVKGRTGKMLKQVLYRGQVCVSMKNSRGVSHKSYVKKLVADAFIPNTENTDLVHHIDGDILNNSVGNLTRGSRGIKIVDIKTGKIFPSLTEAAKAFGMDRETLRHHLSGGSKVNTTSLEYLDESMRPTKRAGVEVRTVFVNKLDKYAHLIDKKKSSFIREITQKSIRPTKSIHLAYFVASHISKFMVLTNTAVSIGREVLYSSGLSAKYKNNDDFSVDAYKIGFDLLSVLFDEGVLKLGKQKYISKKRMESKTIKIVDQDFIDELVSDADILEDAPPLYSRVSFKNPKFFIRDEHEQAGRLIRGLNRKLRDEVTFRGYGRVFETINFQMDNEYKINTDLLKVFNACKEDNVFTKGDKKLKVKQRDSIIYDRDRILKVAGDIADRSFWCYQFYDSRGRIYYSTAYLNYGGSKLAKSLFLFAEKEAIGSEGLFWLKTAAAGAFGEDKISMDARYDFTEKMLPEWLKWAKNPIEHKQWQKADDPTIFLSIIMELEKAYRLEEPTQYESGLPIAIDASSSQLQVMSALARDRRSAELCNITNSDTRNDYYLTIANHAWNKISYTEQDEINFKPVHAKLSKFSRVIWELNDIIDSKRDEASKTEDEELKNIRYKNVRRLKKRLKRVYKLRGSYLKENKDLIKSVSPVFWDREFITALKRKITKIPVMMVFYAGTLVGMSDDIYDQLSIEEEFEGLTKYHCNYMAQLILDSCKALMKGPFEIMNLFIQMGLEAADRGEQLFLKAPFNDFPMMQSYFETFTKIVASYYEGKQIASSLGIRDINTVKRRKVKSASAANGIHQLDSQIVSAVILGAEYPVLTVHDSFACRPNNMGDMFELVREKYAEIFHKDSLKEHLENNGYGHLLDTVTLGDYDVNEVKNNEYAFS